MTGIKKNIKFWTQQKPDPGNNFWAWQDNLGKGWEEAKKENSGISHYLQIPFPYLYFKKSTTRYFKEIFFSILTWSSLLSMRKHLNKYILALTRELGQYWATFLEMRAWGMERLIDSSMIRQLCDSKENWNSFSHSNQWAKNMLCKAMNSCFCFLGGGGGGGGVILALYSEFWHGIQRSTIVIVCLQ